MSKSKGNVISPLEVSSEYGTDALRMGLVVGNTPGTDLNLDPKKIGAYKKFANKLWNITRFVLSQEKSGEIKQELKDEFDAMAADVTKDIEEYRIYMAAEKLYHYVWDRFAAEILEESKGIRQPGRIRRNAVLPIGKFAQAPASVHAVFDRRNLGQHAKQNFTVDG
jgi:valyl-tRNA synthetase